MSMNDNIQLRPIIKWMALLTVTAALSMVFCAFLQTGLGKLKARYFSPPLSPMIKTPDAPPEPRLQADPPLDMERFLAQEEKQLSTYAWIDQTAGVVQLPIERAIQLTAQEQP